MQTWYSGIEATRSMIYGMQEYKPPIDTKILHAIGDVSLVAAVMVGIVGGAMLWRQNIQFKKQKNLKSEHTTLSSPDSVNVKTPEAETPEQHIGSR